MTQPIPSETTEYEQYVDGLRGRDAISEADLIRKIDDHVSEVIAQTSVKKGNITYPPQQSAGRYIPADRASHRRARETTRREAAPIPPRPALAP